MQATIVVIMIIAMISLVYFRNSRKLPSPTVENMPSQDEIVKRALCLTIFLKRFQYEAVTQITADSVNNASSSDKEKFAKLQQELGPNNEEAMRKLQQIISAEGLVVYQSPKEKKLFNKPIGSWSKQDVINASWRKEDLGVLLWSLSMIDEIPAYDKEVGDFQVVDTVFSQPLSKFYSSVKLRPRTEIQKARDIAEHWNWRSRTTQLIKQGGVRPSQGLTFEQIIEKSAEFGFKEGMNPEPISNDFPVLNKAYRDLTNDEYSIITSIAMERHFSLNWLSGYSKDWDNTPTGT